MSARTYRHLQLFCGVGGLSAGIGDAVESHAGITGRWECVAAIDSDPATVEAYNAYTASGHAQVLDLFSREQYQAFHGHAPPSGWREATVDDIRRLCGGRAPDLVASSPPCKGFSGLLPESRSGSAKYQALNGLVFRGTWLVLEAFANDPPASWLLENVPRIRTRGAHYLEQLVALFGSYGYSITGDEHCCGEVGGLAQRRRRYLLVARHRGKVPPLLYRPETRLLRTVGEVLTRLPMPGDERAGAMHCPRRTAFRTALRLALIPPGRDWRALKDLRVADGVLRDFALVPERRWHPGTYGVCRWGAPAGTVTGGAAASTGAFSVADPRPAWGDGTHLSKYSVIPWAGVAKTVSTASQPASGAGCIADPRLGGVRQNNVYRVVAVGEPSPAVTAGGGPSSGGLAVADPRTPREIAGETGWRGGGPYGVVPWDGHAGAVTASADAASGAHSIADPRIPDPGDLGIWVVVSPHGGAWHRPFTTLELAVLQSLITEDDLDAIAAGEEQGPASLATLPASDTQRRTWIGNAVPRATARAIGGVILRALLAAEAGETFQLSASTPWALPRRVAAALSVEDGR